VYVSRVRGMWHVYGVCGTIYIQGFVGGPERKSPTGRHKRRCEKNIKMDLHEFDVHMAERRNIFI